MTLERHSAAIMKRETLRALFESSPSVKLLRSEFAPWILDFLEVAFKSRESIAIPQSELRVLLSNYLNELHRIAPEIMLGPAERYLTQWTEAGWLKRFIDANSSTPLYQLTPSSEEAMHFADSALARRQSIVSTESRLRLVIETLEDVVRGASQDPQRRLDYLLAQRRQIDQEIAALQSGKSVQSYTASQIRERFQTAVELLRGLQSDFRAVEERFQSIAREVQSLNASNSSSRGSILGFALDAEDFLKQQDEGISFFAFVKFLFSPTQQQALRKNIEELQNLAALADQHESLARVRRMVPVLLAEADKVMRTTARLSATLRKLLDGRAAEHRQRLANVLRDIRQSALQLRTSPPEHLTLEIDAELNLVSPLARPFWTRQESFDTSILTPFVTSNEQAQAIATAFSKLQRLDYRVMRRRISDATCDGNQVPLLNLLLTPGISTDMVELLGYIQIAHDDGHIIDSTQCDQITLGESESRSHPIRVQIPRVTFIPKSSHAIPGDKPR